jgi:hypothetical protein
MSTYYSPKITTDGLVLCLDAANNKSYVGSGTTWNDLSGNGTDATLINTPTFTSSFGGNFVLNGTNQYASVSNVYNFATSNQFTAIVWAKSAVSTWNDFGFIISRRDQFVIHPTQSFRDVNYYVNTNVGWQAVTYTVPDITVFAQYVMTYNAGTIDAYHNGLRVTGGSLGATLTSDTGVIEIGKDEGIARYLNGNIANVQLYNRALTATEILNNYNATRARFAL